MKMQKWISLVLLVVVVVTSFGLSGCAAPGMTKAEINRRHVNRIQSDMLMIQDDVDAILMWDQRSRMSPLMIR